MLLFGSIAQSGGGGGGNFWQYSPTESPLIDVKQSTGATGIWQTTPDNERILVNCENVQGSGVKAAAFFRFVGGGFSFSGILDETPNGGDVVAGYANDNGTVFANSVAINGALRELVENPTTNDFTQKNASETAIGEVVEKGDLLNGVEVEKTATINRVKFYEPSSGNTFAEYEQDKNETRVKDLTGSKTFAVLATGEIQTNQAQPHDNSINTLTWDVPVYDTTGTLLGYIKLFT